MQQDLEKVDLSQAVPGGDDERIKQVKERTAADSMLQRLIELVQDGWQIKPKDVSADLKPYFNVRDELVVQDGVIYKGDRCIVPKTLRKDILAKLHSAHMGIVSSLRRARDSVFWPGMNSVINNLIGNCQTCLEVRSRSHQKEPLIPHERPQRPWAKVGITCVPWDDGIILLQWTIGRIILSWTNLKKQIPTASLDVYDGISPHMEFLMR